MSETPETDAIADFYLAKALSNDPADRTVPCQFAARLERDLNLARRERDAWREIATELADAAAYGLAQWDDGYTLEASSKIGESIMRFQKMTKEAAQ